MSSIRLFILGTLATHGDMHGHQLRQLAEKQRVDLWTDITVGGLYGAIKRLATEGLIDELRVEREGSYPERQVWRISDAGRSALTTLRRQGLTEIVLRPDPFELAMSRLDPELVNELPATIDARTEELRTLLRDTIEHYELVGPTLPHTQRFLMTHRIVRLRAEIEWHEELVRTLPQIIEDYESRKDA